MLRTIEKAGASWISLCLLASIWALAGCGDDDGGGGAASVENPFLSDRQLNIAHRGGNREAPEETLESLHSAVKIGVDALEMDIAATSDGVIVLMHDDTVDRTTDGSGLVKDLTLVEIKSLDAGYRHTRDRGETYPFRGQGVTVPTLEEVFATFSDQYMVIEIKQSEPTIIPQLVELLDRMRMRERVIIASFDDAVIQEFRAAAPDVLTSFALGEAITFSLLSAEQESDYEAPAEFLQVPPSFEGLEVLTPEFIDRARRLGLRIHVWGSINAEETMRELLALGVDGLIVDDPERLENVLRSSNGDS